MSATKFHRHEPHPDRTAPFIVGVDPGIRGAIAFYRPTDKALRVFDFPRCNKKNSFTREEISLPDLVRLVAPFLHNTRCLAVVEDVGAMTYIDASGQKRGQGAAASFAFGKAAGGVLGVLASFYVPVVPIRPAVWKALIGLSSSKEASLVKAREVFPNSTHRFTRKKDDGRAEAALLAWYGSRFLSMVVGAGR